MATKTTTAPAKQPKDAAPKLKPVPKQLAACADELYNTRKERLDLQKVVDALQARETQLREHIIDNLPKSQASGIAGKVARATIETRTVYQVKDWAEVHGYILKNAKKNPGVWALLQRRLGDAAVKEVYEAGKTIPGVEAMDLKTVSLNKVA